MIKKLLISIFLAATSYLLVTGSAKADVSCQPIYGGGETCVQIGKILINKMVLNPSTNTFVDNLGTNDPKYGPEFIVTFKLDVTNTGQTNISKVDVKDIFPQFVNFSSGPGNFDNNNKILTFSLDNLQPNETRTFTLLGRVVKSDQLPADQGVVCVVNQAIATASDNAGQSQDNSQLCIQKQVLGAVPPGQIVQPGVTKGGLKVFPQPQAVTTPPTGPEMLPLIGLIPTGLFGLLLRRKSV